MSYLTVRVVLEVFLATTVGYLMLKVSQLCAERPSLGPLIFTIMCHFLLLCSVHCQTDGKDIQVSMYFEHLQP